MRRCHNNEWGWNATQGGSALQQKQPIVNRVANMAAEWHGFRKRTLHQLMFYMSIYSLLSVYNGGDGL